MLGCICLACPRKEQLFGTSWKRLALRSFVGLSVVGMVSSLWFLLCSTETIRGFLMVNTRANGTIFSSDSQAQELFARADARQKLRKKQLKNYCQQHFNQGLPWDRKQSLAHFLIDDENKFIYCAVPKVASTPLKMTLIRLRNESGLKITGSSVHNPKNWRHLSEYNATELSRRLDTHFKFLFVREPFHRLLSGYRDKFFGKNRFYTNYYRAMIVEAFRPQDLQAVATETNNVTFTEFLTYIISYSNAWSRNGHWRQVEHICFPCALEFDFIGHFETLEEDVASVLKKTGFDDRVTFPSIPTSRAASEFVKYFAQVPPEVIYRLGEHYWGDFAMFGYQFPGPLKSFLENYTHPS